MNIKTEVLMPLPASGLWSFNWLWAAYPPRIFIGSERCSLSGQNSLYLWQCHTTGQSGAAKYDNPKI